ATRTAFPHRAVTLATSTPELLTGLDRLADGQPTPAVITGQAGTGKLAFTFSGQGSQYPRMGHTLYATHPIYRQALHDTADALNPHLDQPLLDILHADPDSPEATTIHHTAWTQPTLFALQTALYHLITSHGITPDYLIGHSLGEITAAHLAGILTLDDAARLVTTRAHLLASLPPGGGMLTLHTDEPTTRTLITHHPSIDIAALNSPTNTVIAGDTPTLTHIAEQAALQGIRSRTLTVSHAFHSPLTNPILTPFHTTAATLTYHQPTIPIIAGLTGTLPTDSDHTTADYWTRHIRHTVRYTHGTTTLSEQGVTTYLELGPDTTLTTLTTQTLTTLDRSGHRPRFTATPTLHRTKPPTTTLATALATLQA
ncbi:acyltransferase domain-containing protein, partial [Frankia sp. ACN10a]